MVAADPFVVVAAGRSPFHIAGLLELSELVARMAAGRPSSGGTDIKRTTP